VAIASLVIEFGGALERAQRFLMIEAKTSDRPLQKSVALGALVETA